MNLNLIPAYAAGALAATTGEFSITSATQPGFATIVSNYLSVSVKIAGSKEYVDQNNVEITIPGDTFKSSSCTGW